MPDEKEKGLYLPRLLIEHLHKEAARLGRTPSWCIQFAWRTSRRALEKVEDGAKHETARAVHAARYASDDTRIKESVTFPAETLLEIEEEAARHNMSISTIVKQAWCLAVEALEALDPSKINTD